jgi:hypothetical protein
VKLLRVVSSGLWAVAALLLGHELAYRVVFTDAETRAHALEHTGHGWTGLLLPAFVVAAVAGLVTSFLLGRRAAPRARRAFAWYLPAQILAYVGVEFGERVLAGHQGSVLADMFTGSGLRLLMVGLAAQVLAALLLSLLARTAETVGAAFHPRRRVADAPQSFQVPVQPMFVRNIWSALRSRGPPTTVRAVFASAF